MGNDVQVLFVIPDTKVLEVVDIVTNPAEVAPVGACS